MRDDLTLEEIVTPYYEQIKQLGEMREDYILPYSYLRKLFRHFFTECLYELKYSRKLERRFTRKDYRKQKREINALFKKAFLPVKAEKPETDETPQKKESKAVGQPQAHARPAFPSPPCLAIFHVPPSSSG